MLALVALLLPLAALAAPVKVERAKAFAADFFAQSSPSRSAASFELVWDGEEAGGRSVGEPAFYLFNRTDAPGFVLVAGDDATAPILGYSFEHPFSTVENMPSNLRWWLNGLRETILAARAAGEAAHLEWEGGRSGSRAGEKKLTTALWDQDKPYNGQCPILTGTSEQAVTGCAQTAAAILCQYNQWPDRPLGTTAPGYSYKRADGTQENIPTRTLATKYDYSNMPNVYIEISVENGHYVRKPVYNDEQAAAVAVLMADLGVMNQASYDTSAAGGTAATDEDFYTTMTTYMRYSKKAQLLKRVGYSDAEWAQMLRREIDAGRPLFYAGTGESGGHAFVLDGYKGEDQFSFNWGWSGIANGWFKMTNLNPQNYAFNRGQSSVFGLVKDETGTSSYEDLLMIGPSGALEDERGLCEMSVKEPKKGLPFSVTIQYLWNMSNAIYSGKVNIGHFAADGTLYGPIAKDVELKGANAMAVDEGIRVTMSCTITRNLAVGDYIGVIYWHNQKNQWELARAYYEGTVQTIVIFELDAATLKKGTSLKYDRTTKKLSLKTYNGLKATLMEGTTKALEVDTTGEWQDISAPAGSYKLVVGDEKSGVSCSVNVKL